MDRLSIRTGNIVSVAMSYTPDELAPLGVKLARAAAILRGMRDEDLRTAWQAIDMLASFANVLQAQERKDAAGVHNAEEHNAEGLSRGKRARRPSARVQMPKRSRK